MTSNPFCRHSAALFALTAMLVASAPGISAEVEPAAAFTWGSGENGQLGNGGTTEQSAPVAVTAAVGVLDGKNVTQISAGGGLTGKHSCAVAEGKAYCWGSNFFGQLGNGNTTDRNAPVAVTTTGGVLDGKTVTQVGAGTAHSCALASGKVYCWGDNFFGQLGNGAAGFAAGQTAPVAVTGALDSKTVTQISVGGDHSCALTDEVKVYCWGFGELGQLGNSGITNQNTPPRSARALLTAALSPAARSIAGATTSSASSATAPPASLQGKPHRWP